MEPEYEKEVLVVVVPLIMAVGTVPTVSGLPEPPEGMLKEIVLEPPDVEEVTDGLPEVVAIVKLNVLPCA